MHRTPTPLRRPVHAAGAALLVVTLAGAATGCGSSDDDTSSTAAGTTGAATTAGGTTTPGGTTSTAATGGASSAGGSQAAGTPPAADEGAIRKALALGPAAVKAAGTAHIETEQSTLGISSKGSGTIDLATNAFLVKQQLGGSGAGQGTTVQTYGEGKKIYIRLGSAGGWSVTDTPISVGDPLAQLRQLDKADITKVGGTKEYGGKTCREFTAEVGLKDALSAVQAPELKKFFEKVPGDKKIAVTSCVDDSGLSYASDSTYDIKELLGDALPAGIPSGTSTQKIRITDYGTAPKPQRPAGIDDAKPLGSGSGLGAAG